MSFTVPEKPMLIYPSLMRELGIDAALLLGQCHELLTNPMIAHHSEQGRELLLSREQWAHVTQWWEASTAETLIRRIADAQYLTVSFASDGRVHIREARKAVEPQPMQTADVQPIHQAPSPEVELTELPVYDTPPPMPRRPLPSKNASVRERGPAPVFGGSIGWKKRGNTEAQQDRLQQLFEQHEERNQKLHPMAMGWTPSEMFFSMLPRHQIPKEFAETCLDEFVLYYIDKDRKESNWDQKFLAWVKREWVKKQTQQAREQRQEGFNGTKYEDSRTDTREKRKRVTAAILDIKDTDW
jgi:hypothetical protein